MNNIAFISFTLKALTGALISLSASIPATVPVPVSPTDVRGLVSDTQMIYVQNMLGTNEEANPLYQIKINNQGSVVPTTTVEVAPAQRVFLDTAPMYKICPGYPNGGAPAGSC